MSANLNSAALPQSFWKRMLRSVSKHPVTLKFVYPVLVAVVVFIVTRPEFFQRHSEYAGPWTTGSSVTSVKDAAVLTIDENGHHGWLVAGGLSFEVEPEDPKSWSRGQLKCYTNRHVVGIFTGTPALSSGFGGAPNTLRFESNAFGIPPCISLERPK